MGDRTIVNGVADQLISGGPHLVASVNETLKKPMYYHV